MNFGYDQSGGYNGTGYGPGFVHPGQSLCLNKYKHYISSNYDGKPQNATLSPTQIPNGIYYADWKGLKGWN